MKKFITLAAAILFTGCAPYNVFYDFDRDVKFQEFKTYKWGYMAPEHDALIKNHLLAKRVYNVVDSIMADRGYTKIDDTTAVTDVAVVAYAAVEEKMTVTENYSGVGVYATVPMHGYYGYGSGFYGGGWYSPWWGPSMTVGYSSAPTYSIEHHKEGTLLIDVVDMKTKALAWRGTGIKSIEEFQGAEKASENIRKIVSAIMENYPPEEPLPVALDQRVKRRREERETAKAAEEKQSE